VTLEQMRARMAALLDELRGVDAEAGANTLTADQQTRFDGLAAERETLQASITREEARAVLVAGLGAGEVRTENGDGARPAGAPAVITRTDPLSILDDHSIRGTARSRALRDSLMRIGENHVEGTDNQRYFEGLAKRHSGDHEWAEQILARSSDDYTEAFSKLITGRGHQLTAEESRASIAVGTSTSGGYLVPTNLDPTLMLTNAGSENTVRQFARKVTLTEGKTWNGVTSAGVSASWDAEYDEVSDDTPAFAPASITPTKPQAFIGASIEAFDDIANLTSDVLMLLADAREVLEGAGFAVGTGLNNQPLGLFPAVYAVTTNRITSTTAATIGAVDINAVYKAVPQRFRVRSSWAMNPLYNLAIKLLGTAVSASYSGDLTMPTTDRILGRPVLESDDFPTTQTTTALDQEIVFGDLGQYVIVDKPGSTAIEFVPLLLGSNGRPNGQRGWYMHWRTGGGLPNTAGLRILVDKTSA
jgi:HK97 family phage major capsid protein